MAASLQSDSAMSKLYDANARTKSTVSFRPPEGEAVAIDRGYGKTLRVEIREYKGHQFVDIREWWTDKEGVIQPGKGATIRFSELERVTEALATLLANGTGR